VTDLLDLYILAELLWYVVAAMVAVADWRSRFTADRWRGSRRRAGDAPSRGLRQRYRPLRD